MVMALNFSLKIQSLLHEPQKGGRKETMSNIFVFVIMALMGILGGFSSIYVLVSLPAIIIWKIYRKIRYGYKITD